MKSLAICLSALFLFINIVVARPSRLLERIATRQRKSHPPIRADLTTFLGTGTSSTNITNDKLFTNWAGAALERPPTGTFVGVTGSFVVPTPSGVGAATAWVGIDGDTAQNSILQSGVDFTVADDGTTSFQAWFEWFPNFMVDFTDFPVSAGDTLTVTVVATSSTTGGAEIINRSTGRIVSQNFGAPSSSAALAGQNAEWIVEDFTENGSLVPLTNWGTVSFFSAAAATTPGEFNIGTTGATIINMVQNDKILSSVTVPSSSQVIVSHT